MSDTITVTVTLRRNIAAVRAAAAADGATDAQAWLQGVVDAACYSYRDQFLTDAITSGEFLLRFTSTEMDGIRAAAQVIPELAAWLTRIESIGRPGSPDRFVWLGSDEAQAGKAALVGAALLTQERADVIFDYPLPELPSPP